MTKKSITIRLVDDQESLKWDEFVLSHPASSPYHLIAWKKAIESAYGHKCIYLMAGSENGILGVLPIVHLRFPSIVNEMVSLPFCDVGNCIAEDEKVQDSLIHEAIKIKEQGKIGTFQIRGNLLPTEIVKTQLDTTQTGKVRMVLDLPNSSEKLFGSFKSKLRSQVRKAEKNGVRFFWGAEQDIDSAFRVFSRNMLELGSPVHSKSFLFSVLSNYGTKAKLGITSYQNKIIGMGIILLGGKGVSIPWASTLREYNNLGPNMLLYWNFLKYSADNGFSYFDFGRSSEGEGTYKFKSQWGAKAYPLIWYSTNVKNKKRKVELRKENSNRDRMAKIWKKLPIGVANIVGPCLRKYISL